MTTYSGLDRSTRMTLARSLQGEPLYALVRQLIEDQDADFLTTVQEAGRFTVHLSTLSSFTKKLEERSVLLSAKAHPMVDALGALLVHRTHFDVEYPTPLARQPKLNCTSIKLEISPALSGVVHDIASQVLIDLKAVVDAPGTSGDIELCKGINANIAVLNAVACALNDVPLRQKIRNAGVRRHIDTDAKLDADLMWGASTSDSECDPIAFAVAHNAVDVVREVLDHCADVFDGTIAHWGEDDGSLKQRTVMEVLALNTEPSPEMTALLLDACHSDEKGRAPAISSWINNTLLQNAFDGTWPHLIDLAFDRGLVAIDPQGVIGLASMNAMSEQLDRLAPQMVFPDLEHFTGGQWFGHGHPLRDCMRSVGTGTNADRDQSVVVVLREMERRGLTDGMMAARDQAGHSMASHCIQMGWPCALVTLIDQGLDLDQQVVGKVKFGSLDDVAAFGGHHDAGLILKSARARREALRSVGSGAEASP